MKRYVALILCLLLCWQMPYVYAESSLPVKTNQTADAEAFVGMNVKIDDAFVPGEIFVGIKEVYSAVNRIWKAEDFPELSGIQYIEDLTIAEDENARQAYSKTRHFHQILRLVLEDKSKMAVIQGVEQLAKNEYLSFAQPNRIRQADFESTYPASEPIRANNAPVNNGRYKEYTNDPLLLEQTGLFLHNVDKVWNAFTTGSSSVTVGVIDTGIAGHSDMLGNLTLGYNCTNGVNETSYIDSYSDPTGHGTNVASIIGATGNNGAGMSGVCQDITLYSLRVSDNNGNISDEAIARAFLKANVNNIPIVNISMGGGGFDSLTRTTMNMYSGLIVCSAGNDAREITSEDPYYYPSYQLDNLISVGGINDDITKWEDSNYSSTYVDLMALGNGVCACDKSDLSSGFGYWPGTSMAAPFVAGTAALLLSYDSTLTTAQLKQYICEGVRTSSSLTNYCATGGYLDAYGAFLAMMQDKAKCVNLRVKTHESVMRYQFKVRNTNTYSKLVEIVIPDDIADDINELTITPNGDYINVDLELFFTSQNNTTPLIDFHYISYASVATAKAYVSLQTTHLWGYSNSTITGALSSSKVLVGDVNADNTVNATDQMKILQHAGGSASLTGNNLVAADVDGSFTVNATDAMRVSQYAVGNIKSFY